MDKTTGTIAFGVIATVIALYILSKTDLME